MVRRWSIGSVRCMRCGFAAELLTTDRVRDVKLQLDGFRRCNGCPRCPGVLVLVRAATRIGPRKCKAGLSG